MVVIFVVAPLALELLILRCRFVVVLRIARIVLPEPQKSLVSFVVIHLKLEKGETGELLKFIVIH